MLYTRRALHCHSQGSFFRVLAGKRHPRDIQRVREGAEGLRPHHSEVANASKINLGENAIEHIAKKMHTDPGYNRLPTLITSIYSVSTTSTRYENGAGH